MNYIKTPIHARIYTKEMLKDPDLFMQRVAHFCEYFPALYPEKCGHWEPLQVPFTLSREVIIPNDRNGATDRFYWQRSNKKHAHGWFSPSWAGLIHSTEYLCCESAQVDQQEIIDYVKKTCVQFDADFAVIDMNQSQEIPEQHVGLYDMSPVTHTLKYCLPEMYWGVVFGKPYVDLFGMVHLLNTPAYYVEQLSEHHIYIQLTARIQDVFEHVEQTNTIREHIANYIDPDAFYSEERDFDVGISTRWFLGIDKENYKERVACLPQQTRYIPLYNSPRFQLQSDQYQQAEVAPTDMETYLNELKRIQFTRWQLDLSQWWVLKPFIRPENEPVGLNDGEMDVFEFFHLKNTHTEKPDAFLFIEAYSRYDKLTEEKYCVKLMNELTYEYFYPRGYEYEVWQSLKKEVEYHDDGYAILNIDKYVIYDSEETTERTKLLRFATKALIFKDMVIKVTFKHDSACDLNYSKTLSDPIFESFIAIPKVEK